MSRTKTSVIISVISVLALAAGCGGLPGEAISSSTAASSAHLGDHAVGDDRGGHPVEFEPSQGVDWRQWGTHEPGDDNGGHPRDRTRSLEDLRADRTRARVGDGKPHLDVAPAPRLTLGAKCNTICDCSLGQACGLASGVCELQGDSYYAPCCTKNDGCAPGQLCVNADASKAVCE